MNVWKESIIQRDYDPTMMCEDCSTNEGKFILVVEMGKTENDQDFEKELYYCIDCFKQLMNS